MKKKINNVLLGLLMMILFTYFMGLSDDAYLKNFHQGVWYKDILGSIKYYVLWVLPYWWFVILVGSLILGVLFYSIRIGIGKLTG